MLRLVFHCENKTVPNPVGLAPYRTFTEIGQPESKFVLRLKNGLNVLYSKLMVELEAICNE